jgi:hypothetical protein
MINNTTIEQRFKSSIRRGTGEANLIMQQNPAINFSSEIIKACLKNYAIDGQSEGSRAVYLSELIGLSGQHAKIRKAILNGLESEQEDTWALVQLFDLATFFAKHGDSGAKKAIYNRFFKNIISGSDWCGYASIIELDGLEGLKYIATTIGKSIEPNPGDWQDNSIILHFQEDNPDIRAMQELEKASNNNSYIKTYLANIERTQQSRDNYKEPARVINYTTVTEKINGKFIVPLSPAGAKKLSEGDINKLADDFLNETDRVKLEKYMRIFDKVRFPYNYQPVLEIAKRKNNKNDRLIEFATAALKYFTGDDIRKFAIEKLRSTKSPSDYLDLLVSNYENGDGKLLTAIAKNCKGDNNIHSIVYGYINIYTANKTIECKEPLEAVYEKLTCGIHRQEIIAILIENKVLSDQIRQEIKFDSSLKTRQLYYL